MKNHVEDTNYIKVAPGIWGLKIVFVNIYMIAEDDHWVLVDTGLPGSAGKIRAMATALFGNLPPAAIILTHGHFDHRGALEVLLEEWPVPVYAHPLELPYLTGRSAYSPPDPTVGGGLMSLLSVLYPKRPIDLGDRISALPDDDSIPFLSDWSAVFTPGHAPGHTSLFRKHDKVLIAGDAFVTTKQESAIATLTSELLISGPPKYFTPDWLAAKASVVKLRDLRPSVAVTGHGKPVSGTVLSDGLDRLVENFEELAVPAHGRYVDKPAQADLTGVTYVPPVKGAARLTFAIMAITGIIVLAILKNKKRVTLS